MNRKIGWVIAGVLMANVGAARSQTYGHIEPSQTLDDSVNKGMVLSWRPLAYSSIACTDPRTAVRANLIAQGTSMTDSPELDAEWMQRQQSVHNCWQQPIDKKFQITAAIPVYLNNAMVDWVVGIKIPSTGRVIGYMPIDQIQLIPIATL